jgi:hypothetical protein
MPAWGRPADFPLKEADGAIESGTLRDRLALKAECLLERWFLETLAPFGVS